jgi:hypothetical protein
VAIHPAGIEKAGKVMTGPREKAELQAHSLQMARKTPGAQALRVATMARSNYSCPACNAKLLKRQSRESAKAGEQGN